MVPEDMVPAEFQISCGGGGENAEPDLQYGRPNWNLATMVRLTSVNGFGAAEGARTQNQISNTDALTGT